MPPLPGPPEAALILILRIPTDLLLTTKTDILPRINLLQRLDMVQFRQLDHFPQLLMGKLISLQLSKEFLVGPQRSVT